MIWSTLVFAFQQNSKEDPKTPIRFLGSYSYCEVKLQVTQRDELSPKNGICVCVYIQAALPNQTHEEVKRPCS